MARPQAPRGTEDVLPERIPGFEHVFQSCRTVVERAGYREIRTPLFEETGLFERSIGEVTDIVEKEMFTIRRGDTSYSFRPEGTASVVRAYLEHSLDKTRRFQKLYYIGPMFRYERPTAGRQRQFYQVGIEALGSTSPLLDAEVIVTARRCFEQMGLRNVRLSINSMGDGEDRERYRAVLREFFESRLGERCDDCRRRFERNVFRMLDCKVDGCQASNAAAPPILDSLGAHSRERFDATVRALDAIDVAYEVDPQIVRGLDYYTHTVFEYKCRDLGARDAICGGGRYDNLIAEMGGPALGATGFAIGVTPVLLALEQQNHPAVAAREPGLTAFVAPVSDAEREPAFLLTERLRAGGVCADTDFEGKGLRAQFKAADKRSAQLMIVLGPDEVAERTVKVKDMRAGRDREFTRADDAALASALLDYLAQD